jgi:hypothetical protein
VATEAGKPPVQLIGPDRLADLALEYKAGIKSESLEAHQEDLGSIFEPQLVDDV